MKPLHHKSRVYKEIIHTHIVLKGNKYYLHSYKGFIIRVTTNLHSVLQLQTVLNTRSEYLII